MNTRIRTNDEPVSTRFSETAGRQLPSTPVVVPVRTARVGGIAGMLSPLPLLAAGVITATAGQNLRQNGFPWMATLAAILCAACVVGLTALHSTRWAAPVRAAGLVTTAAILGIAGFFTALRTEDLLATVAGTPRVPQRQPGHHRNRHPDHGRTAISRTADSTCDVRHSPTARPCRCEVAG
jgi:hypothetical protein